MSHSDRRQIDRWIPFFFCLFLLLLLMMLRLKHMFASLFGKCYTKPIFVQTFEVTITISQKIHIHIIIVNHNNCLICRQPYQLFKIVNEYHQMGKKKKKRTPKLPKLQLYLIKRVFLIETGIFYLLMLVMYALTVNSLNFKSDVMFFVPKLQNEGKK